MTEKEIEKYEFLENAKLVADTCTHAVIIGIDKDGDIMRTFLNYDRKKIVEMCQDVIDERQD